MIVVTVARRPLAGSVAATVLQEGTGAINIDACRVATPPSAPDERPEGEILESLAKDFPTVEVDEPENDEPEIIGAIEPDNTEGISLEPEVGRPQGRWPANLILGHRPECRRVGSRRVESTSGVVQEHHRRNVPMGAQGIYGHGEMRGQPIACHVNPDGTEVVEAWECSEGCPVSELDAQSGILKSVSRVLSTCPSQLMGTNTYSYMARGPDWEPYTDVGGASRYFKQVGGEDVVPANLLDYLLLLITPTHIGGESLVALDLDAVDWAAIPDRRYHGVVARGEPTPEQVEAMWRVTRPGAHVLLIAPESCPTGHRGACVLEDRGFEIRDAILWVREAGRLHYVPKTGRRERNLGCEKLAAKRKGPPTYELTEEALADEEAIGELQEALVEAGVDEAVIEAISENGLPKNQVPKAYQHLFKKREGSGKYGNNHPCLPAGEPVLTSQGYRSIETICVGDLVYAADGQFHAVEAVSSHTHTSAEIFQIEVQTVGDVHLLTEATDNHPFLILRLERDIGERITNGSVSWIRADQIRSGDLTLTAIPSEIRDSPMRGLDQFLDFLTEFRDKTRVGQVGRLEVRWILDHLLFVKWEGVWYGLRPVLGVTRRPYGGLVWNLSIEGSPTFQTAVGVSHNTVKPKDVMKRLLADVPTDWVVLDPFLGSGSTGIACLETGHDFIGIERESDYLEIADTRVRYWNRARPLGDHDTTIVSEAVTTDDAPIEGSGPLFDLFDL